MAAAGETKDVEVEEAQSQQEQQLEDEQHRKEAAQRILLGLSEIDTIARHVDFKKSVPKRKKYSFAGALFQSAATLPSESLHQWAQRTLKEIVSHVFYMPEDAYAGLEPMLGDNPTYNKETGKRENGPQSMKELQKDCPFLDGLPDTTERAQLLLATIVQCIGEQRYDARMRCLLKKHASVLGLPDIVVGQAEDALIMRVSAAVLTEKADKKQSSGRWWKIGLAGILGGGLLVVTGGLAAPALIAGIGAVGGTIGGGVAAATGATVAFFSSAGGATLLLSLFGAGGTTLASKKMARRTHGLDVFKFTRLSVDPRKLHGDMIGVAEEAAREEQRKKEEAKEKSWFKKVVPGKMFGRGGTKEDKGVAEGSAASEKKEEEKQGKHKAEEDEATQAANSAVGMHVFVCVTGLLLNEDQTDFERVWGGKENGSAQVINSSASTISATLGIEEAKSQTEKDKKPKTGPPSKSSEKKQTYAKSEVPTTEAQKDTEAAEVEEESTIPKIQSERGWFRKIIPYGEIYTLEWEPEVLQQLGDDVTRFVHKFVSGKVKKEILKQTVLNTVMAAWQIPAQAINILGFIDSTWSMAIDRAAKAGAALADTLEEKAQGNRPVTLIGYSMGARVIFECLEELWRRAYEKKETTEEARDSLHSLIYDVVLLGAPVTASPDRWIKVREIVAGRLVNCYCLNDFVLRYMYRASNLAWHVAGVGPVGVTDNPELAAAHARGDNLEVPDNNTKGASLACTDEQTEEENNPFLGSGKEGPNDSNEGQEEHKKETETCTAHAEETETSQGTSSSAAAATAAESDVSKQQNESGSSQSDHFKYTRSVVHGVAAAPKYVGRKFEAVTSKTTETTGSLLENKEAKKKPVSTTWFHGIESVDVSSIVNGHVDYRSKMQEIMKVIRLDYQSY